MCVCEFVFFSSSFLFLYLVFTTGAVGDGIEKKKKTSTNNVLTNVYLFVCDSVCALYTQSELYLPMDVLTQRDKATERLT